MTEHDLHLLKIFIKKLAEKTKANYKPKFKKPLKELSGEEWTQRYLDQDWEKDKPRMGWWKNES